MNSQITPQPGMTVKIDGMPDRAGTIDKTSTKPGELICRVNDHWYHGSATRPA